MNYASFLRPIFREFQAYVLHMQVCTLSIHDSGLMQSEQGFRALYAKPGATLRAGVGREASSSGRRIQSCVLGPCFEDRPRNGAGEGSHGRQEGS